jgi:hypothetical protein
MRISLPVDSRVLSGDLNQSVISCGILTMSEKLHSHENEQEKNREVFNSAITGQCPHNIENTIMCTSYTFLTNKILAVFFY